MEGPPTPPRIVLHVDMDCFYAAVEMRDDPSLRGVPLVVGADPQGGRGRGVVCTANYPARRYGIRSAMPISQAWRTCPEATFLRPDFRRYAQASHDVMAVLEDYADVLEAVGMDEAYLDVTRRCLDAAGGDEEGAWEHVRSLARSLMAAVARRTGLSCSVGAAAGKSVAKVATERRKPHGLTVVRPGATQAFLDPLPVRVLPGCGPKTAALLADQGWATVGDLAAVPVRELEARLGSHGPWLSRLAHGDDPRPVQAGRGPRKSRGNERTFGSDQGDGGAVVRAAHRLLAEVLDDAAGDGLAFSTLTVKLRYADFTTLTRAWTSPAPWEPGQPATPSLAAGRLEALLGPLLDGRAVRLVGVRLSGFAASRGQRDLGSFGVAGMAAGPRWDASMGLTGPAAASGARPAPSPRSVRRPVFHPGPLEGFAATPT